jgi:hypothetical protein
MLDRELISVHGVGKQHLRALSVAHAQAALEANDPDWPTLREAGFSATWITME